MNKPGGIAVNRSQKPFVIMPHSILFNPNLTDSEQRLWATYNSYAFAGGIFPANRTIMKKLGWGQEKFYSAKRGLQQKGYLTSKQMRKGEMPEKYSTTFENDFGTCLIELYEEPLDRMECATQGYPHSGIPNTPKHGANSNSKQRKIYKKTHTHKSEKPEKEIPNHVMVEILEKAANKHDPQAWIASCMRLYREGKWVAKEMAPQPDPVKEPTIDEMFPWMNGKTPKGSTYKPT